MMSETRVRRSLIAAALISAATSLAAGPVEAHHRGALDRERAQASCLSGS
jgi:hypothetical protein